jgi:hypothetical protein
MTDSFPSHRRKLVNMHLKGTKEEISNTLAVLASSGCTWVSDNEYYPLYSSGEFAYFLGDVTAPSVLDKEKAGE